MKEIIFYGNDSSDISEMAKEAFANIGKDDPSSIYYERHLERPQINWIRIILQIVIPTITFLLTIKLLIKAGISLFLSIAISCSAFVFYILLRLKKILICLIRIYQRFSPDSLRMKCRFEPSCSQYMILSLEKYGTLKGLRLGFKRLGRCRIGNGGYDFP